MIAVLASLAAVLSLSLPGQTVSIDDVGASLRNDPVYVDPQAERGFSPAEADQLRAEIRDAGTPVFVAVLPESASASAEDTLDELLSSTRLAGTYAVVQGDAFRANSTVVRGAGALASTAFQANRDAGTFVVLRSFVTEVSDVAAGGAVPSGGGGTAPSGGADDGGEGSLLPLALLGGGGVALWVWSRRRRRQDNRTVQAEFDADVQLLRAELSVLADDVMRLEPEVVTHPEARADYEAATIRFRAAGAALDYADEQIDLIRVDRVLREAEYAMSRARALVEGREPPAPPSQLRQPGLHDEPALTVDRRGQPVYVDAGTFYGGGGWFGGGSGLFSGLLLGSMLGGFGGFGGGFWGGGHHGGMGGDGGGGGWGGDLGGGDWGGGGDIGGGDW